MRKSALASIIAAFLVPGTAFADSTEGIIEKVDATDNTIMLTDGKKFSLPGEFDFSVIREGMRVLVFYDAENSGYYVTDIEPVDSGRG